MAFSDKLEHWFNDNGRTLPWRGIDDPYRIWVSEIILQQTRIEQGWDYYHRFVAAFPTVSSLAKATEEQVLKVWQGLGYYSRAGNMHAAAQYIMHECQGHFPQSYSEILKLKGVGRYTAAAIASFAFKLPYPVIDGNVYRFISRLRGISTPIGTTTAYNEFERVLSTLIDTLHPDRFNAAMMDFGALQCKPQPDCTACPFSDECVALQTMRVDLLPIKAAKQRPTDRWFYYLDIRWTTGDTRFMTIRQRTGDDIWKGLFEFDLLEPEHRLDDNELQEAVVGYISARYHVANPVFSIGKEFTHQLTHRTIHARFVSVELAQPPDVMPQGIEAIECAKINNIPIPKLIDRYLHQL